MITCILSFEYPPKIVGGLGKAVFEKAEGLSRESRTVIVVPSHGYHKGRQIPLDSEGTYTVNIQKRDRVKIYRLGGRSLERANIYGDLKNKISDFNKAFLLLLDFLGPGKRPDIIDANDWTVILSGIMAKRTFGIPLVFTINICNLSKIALSDILGTKISNDDLQQVLAVLPRDWFEMNFGGIELRKEYDLRGGISIEAVGFLNSDRTVFVSNGYKDEIHELVKKYLGTNLDPGSLDFNYNILDSRLMRSIDKVLPKSENERNMRRDILLKKYGMRPGLLVYNLGRLDAMQKGYDVYLTAIEGILKERDDMKFLIAGRNGTIIGKMVEEMKRKYPKNIIFLGLLSEKKRCELYSISDLFVLPSDFEPFGLTVIESMYGGCPVVATDTSGPGEIVRDFKKRRDGCGIVIPSRFNDFHGDSKKAAAAMKKGILEMASLMEDPGKRASLRRNARKRAAEFDMESSTKNLLRIYRSAGKI